MTLQERHDILNQLQKSYMFLIAYGASKQDALDVVQDQASSYTYETAEDYEYVQSKLKKFTE